MTPVRHLYAHVPFCPSKCSYCAFVSYVGSLKLMEPYLTALMLEARAQSAERAGGPLDTVYLGGGTPSMMTPGQLEVLLGGVDNLWGLATGCEITIEGHPSTVDLAKLTGFAAAGANRISFGAESLQGEELRHLGRVHGVQRVGDVIALSRRAGFRNVNADLMYGIPGQTAESWSRTLTIMLHLAPDHLSLYPLSIEPGTVFARRWREHTLHVPEDEAVAEMYEVACEMLRGSGYIHYEVANWAQPGRECRHNLAYWTNRDFYAIGVGAHGYLRPHRITNIRQTRRYVDRVMSGQSPRSDSVYVDAGVELSETLMLGLRLLQTGIDLDDVRRRFGVDLFADMTANARMMLERGLLQARNGRLLLAESAVPIANEIWEQFVG